MRLMQLNLDRYGPFTGKKIEFSPSAKLHIVFGRNKAGKAVHSPLSPISSLASRGRPALTFFTREKRCGLGPHCALVTASTWSSGGEKIGQF